MTTSTKSTKCGRNPVAGFTLVELLVVLGIIALLVALVAPRVVRYLGEARSEAARMQMTNIESALELYYLDMGRYPEQEHGLTALVSMPPSTEGWRGPYLRKASGFDDPWGRAYIYRSPGEHGPFDLYSLGRDGKSGGDGEDGDISNW